MNFKQILILCLLLSGVFAITLSVNTDDSIVVLEKKNIDKLELSDDLSDQTVNQQVEIQYLVTAVSHDIYQESISNLETLKNFDNLESFLVSSSALEGYDLTGLHLTPISQLNTYSPNISESDNDRITSYSVDDAEYLGIDKLWDKGFTGKDVSIGMFDNGVQLDHENFDGRIVEQKWFRTADNSVDGFVGFELPDHGTPVAGAILGSVNRTFLSFQEVPFGGAYESTLYSAAVNMNELDNGDRYYETGTNNIHYIEAFDYLAGLNDSINLVNFSGGGGLDISGTLIAEKMEQSGILLVVSSGNSGSNDNPYNIACPSCFQSTVSVGAVSRSTGSVTSFSSQGPGLIPGMKPDVVAPGLGLFLPLYSSSGDTQSYGSRSGTSFAAPLITGGLAVLESALNNYTLDFNPGTLKASLIRGAFANNPGNLGNYASGAGIANFSLSYEYLLEHNSSSFANGLALTPLTNTIIRNSYPAGIETNLREYSLITSNTSDVSFSISGNISDILTISEDEINPKLFTQSIPLLLNTKGLSAGETYLGNLTATLGNDKQSIAFSITISDEVQGNLLLDLYHTDFDQFGINLKNGRNIGEYIKEFETQNIWVEEYFNPLTKDILDNYDILWSPDPVSGGQFFGEIFSDQEITLIEEFVDDGKSFFIDFVGLYQFNQNFITGVNVDEVNKVLTRFGLESSPVASNGVSFEFTEQLRNVSSLVQSAEEVTHLGNYMSLHKEDVINKGVLTYYQGSSENTMIASFENYHGGKVLATSTNYWLDNTALLGGYEAKDNLAFAQNSISYLSSSNYLVVDDPVLVDTLVQVDIFHSSSTITAHWESTKEEVKVDNINSSYSQIEIQNTEIHFDRLVIYNEYGYKVIDFTEDIIKPTIEPLFNLENTSIDQNAGIFSLGFNITDDSTDISIFDIDIYLNNVLISEPDEIILNIEFTDNVLTLSIDSTQLEKSVEYILKLEVEDDADNISTFQFIFSLSIDETTIESNSISSTLSNSYVISIISLGLVVILVKFIYTNPKSPKL